MGKFRFIILLLICGGSMSPAFAFDPSERELLKLCKPELEKYCKNYQKDVKRKVLASSTLTCLAENRDKRSVKCDAAMEKYAEAHGIREEDLIEDCCS